MSTDSRGTTHDDGNDSPQVRDLKSKLRQERQKVGRLRLELDSAKDALQQAGLLDPPGELPSSEDEDVEYEDSSGEEDGDVSDASESESASGSDADSEEQDSEEEGAATSPSSARRAGSRMRTSPLARTSAPHAAPLIEWPPEIVGPRSSTPTYDFGALGHVTCDCVAVLGVAACVVGARGQLDSMMEDEIDLSADAGPNSGGFNDGDDDREPNRNQRCAPCCAGTGATSLRSLSPQPLSTASLRRYRCYRAGARGLGYTARRRLPLCFEVAVRAAWPEPSGIYTGYRL